MAKEVEGNKIKTYKEKKMSQTWIKLEGHGGNCRRQKKIEGQALADWWYMLYLRNIGKKGRYTLEQINVEETGDNGNVVFERDWEYCGQRRKQTPLF